MANAGRSKDASIAIIAMTTRSSIRVNALLRRVFIIGCWFGDELRLNFEPKSIRVGEMLQKKLGVSNQKKPFYSMK
ncbi:MAG: hypothetical protein VX413_00055 [Verrucomicrobiota bacterium]|nr:hypothetical protein [Verrucomicrobiota bacterium]